MDSELPPFEVVETREDGRTRLRLRGELDLATVDQVAQRLARMRDRREPALLDLDELDFIDAAGLRCVLTAARESANDGWPFAVTRGSPSVRRLFALVNLDGQIPYEDKES